MIKIIVYRVHSYIGKGDCFRIKHPEKGKTNYKDLNKESNKYEQYEAKARLNLVNKIYQTHDNNLNKKYKVELNQRTIDRVKNSF